MGIEIKEIEGLVLTPLRQVRNAKGDIFHGIKATEKSFNGFGEAYFSNIIPGVIKGWKKHKIATLNIIVPAGSIEFYIYDDRPGSSTKGNYQKIILSAEDPALYSRMTVPPGLWMAFRSLNNKPAMLLDVMNIVHDDNESETMPPDSFKTEF